VCVRKNVAFLIAACALVAAEAGLSAQSRGTIVERVLVRVNGEILTQTQLAQRQTDVIRRRNQNTQNMPDDALVKLLNEITPDLLVDTVDELLLAQRGRELGASFTEELFQKALEGIKKDNNLDDATLREALAQEGITMEQLRANIERQYMIQQVQGQEIFRRMQITDEELRQYYLSHKDQFVSQDTVTLRELSVGAPTQAGQVLSAQELAAAKASIDSIRARAVAGESFDALVKELSQSPTKASGGLIGPLRLQDINPAVKAIIEKLAPGEVSAPVDLPRGGYQLLKLETREAAAQQPFDAVRAQIEQAVRQQRLGGEMDKLLARLRRQAVIEWKDDSLRAMYEARLDDRLTGKVATLTPRP